jgi:single-strand DNA-binding protein
VADEPWAASAPAESGDVWNTPGNYNDETPF